MGSAGSFGEHHNDAFCVCFRHRIGDPAQSRHREAAVSAKHVPKMRRRAQLFRLGVVGSGLILALASGRTAHGKSNDLAPGETFEVVGELYALWVAADLNARKPDMIAIVPLRLRGPEILSVHPLPRGSRIKILRKAEPRWPSFLYPDRYLVESTAVDNAAGLPVVLDLAQGNEGTATSLNPAIYRPLK
jgi:hypothetical protein